jgi:hypothetical protein
MCQQGDKVPLCPRGDEKARFMSRQSGGFFLKLPDGWIVTVDIVADFG